jgi:hypothetical protein
LLILAIFEEEFENQLKKKTSVKKQPFYLKFHLVFVAGIYSAIFPGWN